MIESIVNVAGITTIRFSFLRMVYQVSLISRSAEDMPQGLARTRTYSRMLIQMIGAEIFTPHSVNPMKRKLATPLLSARWLSGYKE